MKPIQNDDLTEGMIVSVIRNKPRTRMMPVQNSPFTVTMQEVVSEDRSYLKRLYKVIQVSRPLMVIEEVVTEFGRLPLKHEQTRKSMIISEHDWVWVDEAFAKAMLPDGDWTGCKFSE